MEFDLLGLLQHGGDHQRRIVRLVLVRLHRNGSGRRRMATDRQTALELHFVLRARAHRQRGATQRAQRAAVSLQRKHHRLLTLVPLRLRPRRHQPRPVKLIRRYRLPPVEPLQRNTKRMRRFYV